MALTPVTSGLVTELYADQSIFTDTGLTTAATAESALIAGWGDQSGNGNNQTQATSGNRPKLRLSSLNGLAGLEFDGAASFMSGAGAINAQAGTIFVVAQNFQRAGPAASVFVNVGAGAAGYNAWHYYGRPQSYLSTGYSSSTRSLAVGYAPQVTAWVLDTTLQRFRLDGREETASAPAAGALSTITLGRTSSSSNWVFGVVYSVIVYNRALTSGEITSVEAFLNTRYGLPHLASTSSNLLMIEGDSIASGFSATNNFTDYVFRPVQSIATVKTAAIESSVISQCTSRISYVTGQFSASRTNNILFFWCGTNDYTNGGRTAAQIYADTKTYCQAIKTACPYVKIIIGGMLPRSGNDTARATLRASQLADFTGSTGMTGVLSAATATTWANLYIDFDAVVRLGGNGAQAFTTYYPDTIHPGNTGQAFIGPLVQYAVQQLILPAASNVLTGINRGDGTNGTLVPVNTRRRAV